MAVWLLFPGMLDTVAFMLGFTFIDSRTTASTKIAQIHTEIVAKVVVVDSGSLIGLRLQRASILFPQREIFAGAKRRPKPARIMFPNKRCQRRLTSAATCGQVKALMVA